MAERREDAQGTCERNFRVGEMERMVSAEGRGCSEMGIWGDAKGRGSRCEGGRMNSSGRRLFVGKEIEGKGVMSRRGIVRR